MDTATAEDDGVRTEIAYFSRDGRYNVEKPYTTSFPVDGIRDPEAKVDNHRFELHLTRVHNARNTFEPVLGVHGFQFLSWTTGLARADFNSSDTIVTHYYAELATLIRSNFPQYRRVAFFDHAIRSRDVRYPRAKGEPTTIAQPFRFAHVDFTEAGARLKLQDALRGLDDADLEHDTRCDILNIWRLLNGKPTRDWPLAFCDWKSVDAGNDSIKNDIVYPRGVGENCFLRSNPEHRWWYLGGQQPNEVAVFRNARLGDDGEPAPCAFHCAFHNPLADETDELRESIEVRLAAFY